MGMIGTPSGHFWDEIKKLIDLPPQCTEIVITMKVDDVVRVDATFIAEKGNGEPISKSYVLLELEDTEKDK